MAGEENGDAFRGDGAAPSGWAPRPPGGDEGHVFGRLGAVEYGSNVGGAYTDEGAVAPEEPPKAGIALPYGLTVEGAGTGVIGDCAAGDVPEIAGDEKLPVLGSVERGN